MAMVVQHNLTAMNSNRMLGITTSSQAKSSEKLSSGYKINRAADDAAGLTISEKMRKQMRGLDRASTNAQDGVSAVQTAEGALTEVHSMLQRMNELAVQSANGTNSSTDRNAIQAEIDQLVEEIGRVAETTKFNETYLLKGDEAKGSKDVYAYRAVDKPEGVTYADGKTFSDFYAAGSTTAYADEASLLADLKAGKKVGTEAAQTTDQTNADEATANTDYTITDATATGATLGVSNTDVEAIFEGAGFDESVTSITYTWDASAASGSGAFTYTDSTGTAQEVNLGAMKTLTGDNNITGTGTIVITRAKVDHDGDIYKLGETTGLSDSEIIKAEDATTQLYKAAATVTQEEATKDEVAYSPAGKAMAQFYDASGNAIAAEDIAAKIEAGDTLYTDKAGADSVAEADMSKYTVKGSVNEALTLSLHVGADSADDNKIKVEIKSMSAAGIGVLGLDVSSEESATAAIDTIASAIQQVSEQRSALGAIQNRLEHTIANLDNVVENTTSAESRIRDTDMAEEMVEYSKNNILAQAGQSMLAQANQATQGVLSLLG